MTLYWLELDQPAPDPQFSLESIKPFQILMRQIGALNMQLLVIFGILVAIGGVVFALQNNVPVTITFLVWRFDSSLAMVLLLALGIGAMIVALVSTPAALRSRWTLGRMRKEIASLKASKDELEAQIANPTRKNAAGTFTGDSRGPMRDD